MMKLLTPYDVAERTGLPYKVALPLVKELPHLKIGNRYYLTPEAYDTYLTSPTETFEITFTNQEE